MSHLTGVTITGSVAIGLTLIYVAIVYIGTIFNRRRLDRQLKDFRQRRRVAPSQESTIQTPTSAILYRLYQNPAAWLVAIGLFIVFASDLPDGLLSSFWVAHPAIVGLLTGVLIVGLTGVVINQIAIELDARRSRHIAGTVYLTIAVPIDQLTLRLVCLVYPESISENDMDEFLADIRDLAIEVLKSPAARVPVDENDEPMKRVDALFTNPQWLSLAIGVLGTFRRQYLNEITPWVSVLQSSHESLEAFRRVGALDASVRYIRDVVRDAFMDSLRADEPQSGSVMKSHIFFTEWKAAILESWALSSLLYLGSGNKSSLGQSAIPYVIFGEPMWQPTWDYDQSAIACKANDDLITMFRQPYHVFRSRHPYEGEPDPEAFPAENKAYWHKWWEERTPNDQEQKQA